MQQTYYLSVNAKGQVTLPKVIRAALGIQPGVKLPITYNGEKVIINKTKVKSLEEIRAQFKAEATKRPPFKSMEDIYNQLSPEDLNR